MRDKTRPAAVPTEDPMLLRSSLAKLLGVSLSRWAGAVALIGLFSVSAGGCGGCDDSSLVCDPNGQNCKLCDAYGCRDANPSVGGAGGQSGTSGSGSPSCDQNATTCPCASTSDCTNGLVCVNSLCIDGCQFSYECGAGNVCLNGGCAAGCDAQTPCAKGYTCQNGACQIDPQNPECTAQIPCPQPGYICKNGLCTTQCDVNADCSPGTICDSASHSCIADPSPKPTCSDVVKCTGVGQVCLADGYCHYPCNSVNECQLIDSRFVDCVSNICKTQEELKPPCVLKTDCMAGQNCISNKCQ
jgi:hypothetical protein